MPKKRASAGESTYTEEEKSLVLRYLKEEIEKGNHTESKWTIVSEKLKAEGLARSNNSVKMWWSRYGRAETGFEERMPRKHYSRNLVTSHQDPLQRKQARDLKKENRKERGLEKGLKQPTKVQKKRKREGEEDRDQGDENAGTEDFENTEERIGETSQSRRNRRPRQASPM